MLQKFQGRLIGCRNRLKFTLIIFVCGLSMGCRYGINWGSPGTIGQQRARVQVHDPFPNNDLGPPIVSGRPQGFEHPTSEVNRLQRDNPFARRNQLTTPWSAAPFPGNAAPPFQPNPSLGQPPQYPQFNPQFNPPPNSNF